MTGLRPVMFSRESSTEQLHLDQKGFRYDVASVPAPEARESDGAWALVRVSRTSLGAARAPPGQIMLQQFDAAELRRLERRGLGKCEERSETRG